MRLREVIHTCSNDKVAEAALISLGGAFAKIVAVAAARRGFPQGRFVAELTREFERHAGTCVWARAEQAMRGADQPVLVGLYVILAHGLLEENLRATSDGAKRVPEAPASSFEAGIDGGLKGRLRLTSGQGKAAHRGSGASPLSCSSH
jgi:hypothetical protein